MSFGLSLGDLISACELGKLIYDRCFTKAERAGKLRSDSCRASRTARLLPVPRVLHVQEQDYKTRRSFVSSSRFFRFASTSACLTIC